MIKPAFLITLALAFVYSTAAQASLLAVSMPRFDDNFLTIVRNNIESRADLLDLVVYVDDAEERTATQLEQIRRFAQADADAIIVMPVSTEKEHIDAIFSALNGKKIPLVFLQRDPGLETYPDNVVFVGSNEVESGTMQMEALARQAGFRGKVAILQGAEGHQAAEIRTQDVHDVVGKYPNLEITLQERGSWARNQALNVVGRWLKESPDEFSIIAANNDEMALGAILALRQAGVDPNKYLIGGIDATRDALASMQEGVLDVTVFQDAAGQGRGAVDAAQSMLNGEAVPDKIWVPFKLVTPANASQFVQ